MVHKCLMNKRKLYRIQVFTYIVIQDNKQTYKKKKIVLSQIARYITIIKNIYI